MADGGIVAQCFGAQSLACPHPPAGLQLAEGLLTLSITITSTGALVDSSFNPNSWTKAVNRSGGASALWGGGGGAAPSRPGPAAVSGVYLSVKSNRSVRP